MTGSQLATLDRTAYTVDGVVPSDIRIPRTIDEVVEASREAAVNHWSVIPWGGGTQMALGNVPRSADVAIDLTALNAVVEYEPADLVVTVQAGIRFGDLQRLLAEHGQCLALDPPLPDQATVGGTIAANASGPLRLRYGTCRDQLLGLSVVDANGVLTKAGGRVVKNVTGYDLGKLYTGSLGTLGIIVQASFKLAPLPRIERTVIATFGDVEAALAALEALRQRALPLRACELISPAAHDGHDWQLAVWIGGGEAAVERQLKDTWEALDEGSPRTIEGDEQQRLWRAIEDFGYEPEVESRARISVAPSRLPELLDALPADSSSMSHALTGVAYVKGNVATDLRDRVRGYVVLERCPLPLKHELDVWGPTGTDFDLMKRIKHEFDPENRLNPGRYVGRL